MTADLLLFILVGAVVGQILMRLGSRLSRRMGWTQALEARLQEPFDRICTAIGAGISGVAAAFDSEMFMLIVLVIAVVTGGSAFVLGMSAVV